MLAEVKPSAASAGDEAANTAAETPLRKAPGKTPKTMTLLGLERAAYACTSRSDLKFLAVTSTRSLAPYQHAFLITRHGDRWRVQAITSQAAVDPQSPFLQWLTKTLSREARKNSFHEHLAFSLTDTSPENAIDYPFTSALWAPFAPSPETGGILFTRDAPWQEEESRLLAHISAQYGCCWLALGQKKNRVSLRTGTRAGLAAALLVAVFLLPVPVTTLAPAEVIARQPQIVSAPIDGVIRQMHIPPNSLVQKGDLLASYTGTSYRNDDRLAESELAIAEARLRQAALKSYVDSATKQQLAIARAELDLAEARKAYTAEKLSRIDIRAERSGLLIYTDENDWVGRPVRTGERLMEIAAPDRTLLRIEAPVTDSSLLSGGAKVRFFLDAKPLSPLTAALTQASYQATPQPGGTIAYEAFAQFSGDNPQPRIGTRGVAKIYGGKAPLGYWLFRRPISALRQFFGL